MALVDSYSPILYKPSEEVTDFNEAAEIVDELKTVMMFKKALGVSACQIGISKRIFVMGNFVEKDSIMTFINPTIVYKSPETNFMKEGCLSFPAMEIPVSRSNEIRIRFSNLKGEVDTIKLSGLSARVAQHEMDHLDGTTFLSYASKLQLTMIEKKFKKHNVPIKYDFTKLYSLTR